MSRERNYYEVLGVGRSANADEIRAAHRRLVREHHPDVSKAENAAERFNEIQEAYDTLSDESKRAEYDKIGHRGWVSGHRAAPGGASGVHWSGVDGGGSSAVDFDFGDLGSMFEDMFGARGGASPFSTRSAQQRSRPGKGQRLQHEVVVPFDTALHGGTRSIRIARGGASQTIDIKIPRGVADGAKLRVKGAGHPSASGGLPGDLIVVVRVAEHPYLKRDGLDVSIEVPISIVEATLGGTMTVPTPAGEIELTIPPGSPSGSRLRVRNHGAEDASGEKGDFFAILKIVPPKNLTERQRETIERIGASIENPRSGPPWGSSS